jgi:hypothetical protein
LYDDVSVKISVAWHRQWLTKYYKISS